MAPETLKPKTKPPGTAAASPTPGAAAAGTKPASEGLGQKINPTKAAPAAKSSNESGFRQYAGLAAGSGKVVVPPVKLAAAPRGGASPAPGKAAPLRGGASPAPGAAPAAAPAATPAALLVDDALVGADRPSPSKPAAAGSPLAPGAVKAASGLKASSPKASPTKAGLTKTGKPAGKRVGGRVSLKGTTPAASEDGGGDVSSGRATEDGSADAGLVVVVAVQDVVAERLQQLANDPVAQKDLEDLRASAWRAQVAADRRREQQLAIAASEESRRRREETALRKALLEAAFEDDVVVFKNLLDRAAALITNVVDAADAHNNSLLSEAAAGGSVDNIKLLLRKNANPNVQGEFGRTALWRAAFLGQEAAVPLLLQGGADPRIGNEGNELPAHVTTNSEIKRMLKDWDIFKTNRLLLDLQARLNERLLSESLDRMAAMKGAEEELDLAKVANDAAQKALKFARQELEKRIFEHDTCVDECKSGDLIQATLDCIKTSEANVLAAKMRTANAADALDVAKLVLREKQQNETPLEAPVGIQVDIKDLDDVLVRDVGDKMAQDGRWPLVIDPSGQASVFFRYLDTNYVNALSRDNTDPHALRRSILGAIRYGKPLVVDQLDCDLWENLGRLFDRVQQNLLPELMDRSLLKKGRYLSLARPTDGEDYEPNKFQDSLVARFKVILLTSSTQPNQGMVEQCYPFRVVLKHA